MKLFPLLRWELQTEKKIKKKIDEYRDSISVESNLQLEVIFVPIPSTPSQSLLISEDRPQLASPTTRTLPTGYLVRFELS